MITLLAKSEFSQVLALQRSMLVEAGLGSWEIEPWLTRAEARIAQDELAGTGAYFVAHINGEPTGMVGALLRNHHAFLSTSTDCYGCIVDEYVLPSHRGQLIEQRLRAAAISWIEKRGAPVLQATPPHVARIAALRGWK